MNMYVTSDAKHIVVPWQESLARVIPHARSFEHEGRRMLILPNRQDEARVARNLGVPVPAPVLTSYDWLGKTPWDVQRATTALLTESKRAYVLNEFGTGKTRSVIWAADYLKVSPVLVTAPLSVLTPVWEAELFRVSPRFRVKILHGTKAQRIERLWEPADWYIINHDGLDLILDELIRRRFEIFVVDELAVLRNRQTDRWKAANRLVESGIKYVWGLTGSPTPKAPTDAWAQIKLLTPGQTTRTFGRFRDMTMRQITQFKW